MTLLLGVNFQTDECSCGGVYALTADFLRQARETGKSWKCPYCGMSRCYRESDVQRLQKQLSDKEKAIVAERARHDQTREELSHTQRRLSAAKGVNTRTKNRISRGVCPCCNRTFQDLQRHMATKHPSYAGAESES